MSENVRAAGGVVWRRSGGGVEVLLVHRPRYLDWTFPKGKAMDDESDEETARREVREETGLDCELGPELATTYYDDSRNRPKTVRYWAMESCTGRFEPHAEVDEIRWLTPDGARELLTYARDHEVLDSLERIV